MNKHSNWAIVGLGFISQRHLQAIEDVGDKLIMACDIDPAKKDKVPEIPFFENFESMLSDPKFAEVDWVAICTPNYLHFPMMMAAAKRGKKILCEKPFVINPDNLELLPKEGVFSVLQLRHNPELIAFKETIDPNHVYRVDMNISVHRGEFYFQTWKGKSEQSGGLLYNIGVHYFDLLLWFFGEPTAYKLETFTPKSSTGTLAFKNAEVAWAIRIDAPMDNQIRRIAVDGKHLDLTRHFEDLHTRVYRDVKAGRGITPKEAGRSIRLLSKLTPKEDKI